MAVTGTDDFESGDLASPTGSLVWGDSTIFDGPGDIEVVSGIGKDGGYGLLLRYGPDAAGEDTACEQHFEIPGLWPDFGIVFDLFIPANYRHRDDRPSNNKLLALWHDTYGNAATEPHVVIELERETDDESWIRISSAHAEACETRFPDDVSFGLAPLITAADHGTWIQVIVAVHAEYQNSFIYIYKNGSVIAGISPSQHYSITCPAWSGLESWNFGYLMGWSNSGFEEQTDFVIDNVVVVDAFTSTGVAVAKGVSAGFVAAQPSADPGGSQGQIDALAAATDDTTPDYSCRVVGAGWWCDNATQAANYEMGIYSDAGASEPEARLFASQTNAKGTGSGWKHVTGLDWLLSPSTKYWVAAQCDDTATLTASDSSSVVGANTAVVSAATLPSDWGTSLSKVADTVSALYAHIVPHIPPKAVLTRMRAT